MKATNADYELAKRFPEKANGWGFAKSMSDARISPQQLSRLLQLGLLKASRENSASPSATVRQGVGAFFRKTDHYIRTFKDKP